MTTPNPYGPIGNAIGTLFWFIAFAAFTSPFWLPFAALLVGILLGWI